MKTRTAQRIWGALLALGAGILLFRTLRMLLVERAWEMLLPWVVVALLAELLVDAACFGLSLRWAFLGETRASRVALRVGAAATILHALRVAIYVLGRAGPWRDFDRRPEFRGSTPVNWFWTWFAAVLSVAGLLVVLVIFLLRKRAERRRGQGMSG